MNKEESLRAQAAHNIPCFIHECPLHDPRMSTTRNMSALVDGTILLWRHSYRHLRKP